MPQIWLTYEEAGAFLGCSPIAARAHSIARQWDRKRSRDGEARVKLPEAETLDYLDSFARERVSLMGASSLPVRRMQEDVAELSATFRRSA